MTVHLHEHVFLTLNLNISSCVSFVELSFLAETKREKKEEKKTS